LNSLYAKAEIWGCLEYDFSKIMTVPLVRRSSTADVNDVRLRWLGISDKVSMVDGDLLDLSCLLRIVRDVKPSEVYNLAAQSFVKSSWHQPLLTGQVTGLGVTNVLEAVRIEHPTARFYQASSRNPSSRRRRRSIRGRPMPLRSSTATG